MMGFFAISNGFTSAIAKLFHPIVYATAWMLAFIYGLIPNYGVAIAILTVIIMGLLTPLTVKSTRSMIAMQRLQPELKKLQQKYKGPEHRQELNEEMMKLYREQGVNPASGCVNGLLMAPFLFILYSVIRGLSNVVKVHGVLTAVPKNIPSTSKMAHDLLAARPPGSMNVWGMNIALKPFSPHGSVAAAIPFFVFIAVAVGVQYYQMSSLNRRNPNQSQMSNQMQVFQKLTPILFAYIYFLVPAAAVIYMIVSSIIRIITQDVIFRFDAPKARAKERSIPAVAGDPAAAAALSSGGASGDTKVTSTPPTNGKAGGSASNGATSGTRTTTRAAASAAPKPPSHPRSKDKKKRKAR